MCECNHLTLFEALWDISWWEGEIYSTIGLPVASLPFSRWHQLWAGILALDATQKAPFDLIPEKNREAVLSSIIEATTTPEALQAVVQSEN